MENTLDQSFVRQMKTINDNFIDYMNKLTKTENAKEKLLNMFQDIIGEQRNLNDEEFDIIGTYSYLIGLEFTSQNHLSKITQDAIFKRINDFVFNDYEFASKLVDVIKYCKVDKINDAKECMKNRVNKEVTNFTDKMWNNIINLIYNSVVDVKYAESICDLISDKKYTYKQILTLNNAINNYLKLYGENAIKNMIDLLENPAWQIALTKATEYFDDSKYSIILFDMIISVNEVIDTKFTKEQLINTMLGKYNDQDFERIKREYEETHQVENEKPAERERISSKFNEEQLKDMAVNNPLAALIMTLDDVSDKNLTIENIHEKIDVIFKDYEFLSDFYSWLKGTSSIADKTFEFDQKEFNIDIVKFKESIENKIEEYNAQYKEFAEQICKQLHPETLSKLKFLFTETMKGLILDNVQQKSVVISNFRDTNLSTYQHAIQMLSIIESCEIKGTRIKSYKKLKDFCTNQGNFGTNLANVTDSEILESKISVYREIKKLLDKHKIVK